MILNSKPLAIVEAADYVKKDDKKPIHDYFKAFVKADLKQAGAIREGLTAMNNAKIREHNIVKVIDIMPQDSEEVNKIFNDVSLSEEEINAILNVVKK